MTGDEGYRRLYGVLNRYRVFLRLPAGVLGAVILYDGGDAADLGFVLQRPPLTGQSLDQSLRFLLLTRRAFLHHFLENAARAFRISHVHVGPR